MGKVKQAYLVLQNAVEGACHTVSEDKAPDCIDGIRYLYAKVCLALEKLQEAESTLVASNWGGGTRDLLQLNAAKSIPGGAAGVFLLGKVCRKQHRNSAAIHYFNLALQVMTHPLTNLTSTFFAFRLW